MLKIVLILPICIIFGCCYSLCQKRIYTWEDYFPKYNSLNDSILNSKEFQMFLNKYSNKNRDTNTIDSLIKLSKSIIESWLIKNTEIFLGNDTTQIHFRINNVGEIDYIYSLNTNIDTQQINILFSKLNKYSLKFMADSTIETEINIGAIKNADKIIIYRIGQPIFVKKGRQRSEIMKVVLSHVKELKNEYNKQLKNNINTCGKIIVRFIIRENGLIDKISVIESSFCDSTFDLKITNIIKQWKFPVIISTYDIADVIYPFVFSY